MSAAAPLLEPAATEGGLLLCGRCGRVFVRPVFGRLADYLAILRAWASFHACP